MEYSKSKKVSDGKVEAEMKQKFDAFVNRVLKVAPGERRFAQRTEYLLPRSRIDYDQIKACLQRVCPRPVEVQGVTFFASTGTKEDHTEAAFLEDGQFIVLTALPAGRETRSFIQKDLVAVNIPDALIKEARSLRPGESISINSECIFDTLLIPFSEEELRGALDREKLERVAFFGCKNKDGVVRLTLWCK